MNKTVPAAALVACTFAVAAHAACEHTARRAVDSAGPGIERVVVEAGAGDLVVRGRDGGDVRADGRACASSAELLDETRLEIRREGNTVYLRTVLPEISHALLGFMRYAYIDLSVDVPKTALLELEDSSGDLQVSDVQGATIVDSSGDQRVERVAGDLDISDSSGEITVEDVGGKLQLKDSSGDVEVDGVQGDVLVTVDSSGDLDIRHVMGGVHILSDSSGGIEIEDVRRDVVIDNDSSGSIQVREVGGNFTVGSDGSGSIRYDRVAGRVSVPD